MVTNKRILITAGPTWVAIDQARVISNIASGETGFLLADKLKKNGAKVTLLLGQGSFLGSEKGIRILRFKYFSELEKLLKIELKKYRYTAIIHAAAVSDYQQKKVIRNKISSDLKKLRIDLVPTKKLINGLKNNNADLFTVGFKFEPIAKRIKLIEKAKLLLKQSNLNLVVGNSYQNNIYCAFITDGIRNYGPFLNKKTMVNGLFKLIKDKLI